VSPAAVASQLRATASVYDESCYISDVDAVTVRVDEKTRNWIGVLDDDEMDALDDALRLYHGLL